jgi:hypothetical protein
MLVTALVPGRRFAAPGMIAFRAIDIPEDRALKAAAALGKRDDEVGAPRSELPVIKWMMGFVLAFQGTIFVKAFIR